MLRMIIVLAASVIAMPVFSALPLGMFSNMRYSPVTGDTGGFEVTINKIKGQYGGQYSEAAGVREDPVPLSDIRCDEKKGSCTFTFKRDSHIAGATLTRIKTGAILTIKDARPLLLFENGKEIKLPPEDNYSFARGPAYENNTKNSKVLLNLQPDTKVKFIEYHNDTDYMAKIEYSGKQVFVLLDDFGQTSPQAIIGDNVRFRSGPSTGSAIINVFKKGTIVGYMYEVDEGWVKVTSGGKTGYVSKDFITGY